MTKKNLFLALLVLALAALSLYLNKDRFRGESIQIGSRWVTPRGWMRRNRKSPGKQLVFLLNNKYELTSVKVIPVDDIKTNRFPHPIWELTTDSNSVPTKEFFYGRNIRGMKPSVKGATPGELEPGVAYRLFVEAGSLKAQQDFTGAPATP
ncbi:MAG TPA: hypothetical protein VFM25_06160 [Verrucomicrobiae bacterium]|jgi:hypothetical protein|nr:hypothetical protein [Verrucomicrobiae bacterium]